MDHDMDVEDIDCDEEYIEECETDLEEDEFDEIIPMKEDAKYVLQGHKNVVLSVLCNNDKSLIFTGSMDDTIIVWSLENGTQVATLTGHSDSVTKLSINKSDSFLASGDLQGTVIIWKISKNPINIIKYKTIEMSEIVDMKWYTDNVSSEEYLYVCDKTGTVQSFALDAIADSSFQEVSPLFYSQGKGCCCSGFSLILSGKYATVLYGGSCDLHEDCSNTKQLSLVNVETYKPIKIDLRSVANHPAHDDDDEDSDEGLGAAFVTHAAHNSELVAIGDWNQLIIVSISEKPGSSDDACWKLERISLKTSGLVTNAAFASNSSPLLLAFASRRGSIGVVDVTHNRLRHEWSYSNVLPPRSEFAEDEDFQSELPSVSQLSWHQIDNVPMLLTAGTDGRLCQWDARLGPTAEARCWWGHTGIMWDMFVTVSVDNRAVVITASEDKTARVFEI